MDIITEYIEGLKNAYHKAGFEEECQTFFAAAHGASEDDLNQLRQAYPEIPELLIALLQKIDGSYWRKYGDSTFAFYFLGSDIFEYPYYLLSAQEILKNKNLASHYYDDYIDRVYTPDEVMMDEKIAADSSKTCWLHFSDCMNNGGTSQLFIDFTPSEKGVRGQIVRFLHDPDEMQVIADSFEDYLQKIMDDGFSFIQED